MRRLNQSVLAFNTKSSLLFYIIYAAIFSTGSLSGMGNRLVLKSQMDNLNFSLYWRKRQESAPYHLEIKE